MVLINPPLLRNCEPPVALSRLGGALIASGETVILIDGAQEGLDWLVHQNEREGKNNAQTRRVGKNREKILKTLSTPHGYESFDRYKKNINDYGLLLNSSLKEGSLTPADYNHPTLSPLRSQDLVWAAEHPEEDPFYPWFKERLTKIFHGNEDKLGLSLGYLSQALTTMAILGFVKREWPQVRVILGGSLVNSWAKGPGVDVFKPYTQEISTGPGEQRVVRFAQRQFAGPGEPFLGDLVEHNYMAPGLILPYSSSLGCSWKRCTFCAEKWEDNLFFENKTHTSLKQIHSLVKKHNPTLLHITDSEISPALLEGLIASPPGVAWYGFSRFLKEMTSLDYCKALAESGCTMLCMGLESGDQNVLNQLKKGIRLDMVSPILKNLKEVGIGTFIYLLFGTPAETKQEAMNTKAFVLDHLDYIDFLNLAIFTMPHNSQEAQELETESFYEGDLSLSTNFTHPKGWSRREVRLFLEKEFRKCPSIRGILKRTPPVYTSSHAPFFLPFGNK